MGGTSTNGRFYVTSQGYFRLRPLVMSISGIFCDFFGGKSPFLLRTEGESYQIVAETYVQEFMSGETVFEIQNGGLTVGIIL